MYGRKAAIRLIFIAAYFRMNEYGENGRRSRRWGGEQSYLWNSAGSAWYNPFSDHPAPCGSSAFPLDEEPRHAPKGIMRSAWEEFVSPHESWYPKDGSLHFSPAEVGNLTINIPRIRIAVSLWKGAWSNRGNHRSGFINQHSLSFLNMNFSQGFWETCREPDVPKRRNGWRQKLRNKQKVI